MPRPRLIERLNNGIHSGRRLTLISAPAGFGKTTLVSDWIRQADRPVAWVSLDEGDNDPVRFWRYVIAALQTIQGGIGAASLAALQDYHLRQLSLASAPRSGAEQIETLLTGLVNELDERSDPVALVLDDLHVITQEQNHNALLFLVRGLPPQVHLVLSTRADPPWPLARLRARRQLTELRTADLRFTPEEAVTFLNGVMGLGLSTDDIVALDVRTEGWIAGLQLAALSMQGRKDIPRFIEAFSGSHRFVLDYLMEEVLDRQSSDTQDFLLKTSILERMTASLCEAVMSRDDGSDGLTTSSQPILAQLEQANLFLVPLDDERRWYRYHRLFADLLRSRLEQTHPDQVPALHRRASEWYEERGVSDEAISHALAAGDPERMARLVAQSAFTMIYRGQLTTLAGWLDALPREVVRSQPWLSVAHAWVLAYSGSLDAVEALLQDAERASKAPGEKVDVGARAEQEHVAGHIATIRGYRAMFAGDSAHAAELARRALDSLPPDDLRTRSFAALVLGVTLGMGGDLVAGTRTLVQAASTSRAASDTLLTAMVLSDLVTFQRWQGQLREASATCHDALQLADEYARQSGQQPPAAGFVCSRQSEVLREWNDLEAATRYAQRAVELGERWGQRDSLVIGYSRLALALQAQGDMDGALDAIRKTKQVAGELAPPERARAAAIEARLRLAQGDVAAASRWARESGLGVEDDLCFDRVPDYHILARWLVVRGRQQVPGVLDRALALLARLLRVAEAAGAMGHVIELLALQAVALRAQGEGERALATLERALHLAEPEGYVRTFVEQGEPMTQLLLQAAAQGIAVHYVARLLAALEADGHSSPSMPGTDLLEPLSERELDVLRLLATSLSTSEIANQLSIALSTLRTHVKHIYGKLGVHSRREAVARAQELGLV